MGEAADIEVRPPVPVSDGALPYQKTSWTSVNVQTAGPEGRRGLSLNPSGAYRTIANM
jgi:hypothetical protein